MSLTRLNVPHVYSPVFSQAYHRISSNSADTANFKYVFKVYTGITSTYGKVSTHFVFPSESTYGEFNPNAILKSYLSYDYNPFGTGTTFANNAPNSILKYKIEYGEQIPVSGATYYFSSITNNLGYTQFNFSVNPNFAVGDEIKIVKDATINASYNGFNTVTSISATTGIVTNSRYGVDPEVNVFETGYTTIWQAMNPSLTFTGYVMNNAYRHLEGGINNMNYGSSYSLKDVNSKYLTNRNLYHLYRDQSYSLSLLNTGITQPFYLMIKGFSGGSQQTLFQYPISVPANFMRYDINIGFPNLKNIIYIEGFSFTIQPLVHSGLDYYTVDLTTSIVSQLIERKTIYIRHNCETYTRYILAYLNPRGGFDNLYFNFKSKSKFKFEKDSYVKSFNYNYAVSDFGDHTLYANSEEVITVSTDLLKDDDELILYRELMASPVVYWQDEDNQRLIPIQILNRDFEPEKRENGDSYFVEVDFKLAYRDDIQLN